MKRESPTQKLPRLVYHKTLVTSDVLNYRPQPEDWDEDAPYEIPDEDAVKPEGWLDDEPETVHDPGSYPLIVCVYEINPL